MAGTDAADDGGTTEKEIVEREPDAELRRRDAGDTNAEGPSRSELDGREVGAVLFYSLRCLPFCFRLSATDGYFSGSEYIYYSILLRNQFVC